MLGTSPILPLPAPPLDGNLGPTPPAQVLEEPKDDKMEENEEENNKADNVSTSVATHTRTIGIIYPPPDIRSIVDKTSQFVAKNGPEFEKRIVQSNAGNAKFNFLNASDPYHAYYQHRLAEARSQNQASGELPTHPEDKEAAPAPPIADAAEATAKPDLSAQFRPVIKVLEPPEAEQYTVRLPEGITGEELDIIKLTSQFVARNGKSFLTGLTSREINNPQFHFLKPTHSMFMFFTSLADAYSKVLMPPKGLMDKLQKSAADMTTVLERCLRRLEWERSQEQARQKAEDEIEQERLQMAMIDWHDFVVVETIDFSDDEDQDLPPPMTLEEVIRRSKMPMLEEEDYVEPGKEVEMEMDEEEVQLVEEGMRAANLEENGGIKSAETMAIPEEKDPPMRIVKNWKRPEERIPAERDTTKYVVSPITGELIPINEMSEHMRISLIDPKYKEQKDRMFAKIKGTTLAQDDEISRNIVGLARTRPDIFGTTEEEVSNAVKAEIEKRMEESKQVIWDGHTGSIGRTASHVMSQNNTDDQNDTANDARNLPGPQAPPPLRPGLPSVRPLPPPPGLVLNIPRPPNTVQYSTPTSAGVAAPSPPRPAMVNMIPQARPPPPPMPQMPGQQNLMVNHPPMPPSMAMNSHSLPIPPPPGSQFASLGAPRPFVPHPMSQPGMSMVPPPPMPQGMPPPPPPEEAPPLPEEPEPKRQKLDESILIPEDQFLDQHSGPARINVSVPNTDEGNLKGQVLGITVQSLSETIASLKEKISGEIQLPANKQKLSGKAGFLKDNLSLAYYNIAFGETLSLSLRERGGRKR
ncbi:putative splicing factor 3A subunit 1 [Capsicum annuum]|uniref:probable splicing factor 3A subunit 1 n=1 Tax=Capsicum annuum TaxID=4072 RepID=UPI0007BEFBF6|nr:probable splicing factor 3A subunit 1 [Capsicum annuum]XP_016560291.1 probable splicing factor 3A subunit 1 [Capsicum annuum]XP_016560292.1 probable splicing factor 3A subunit 1 [Capsicum annuum]XP_047263086.1 probable splicing factor 3A subunit 1 [Capsicum annuum]XP_047263087.1 probable splicing factor 3A subunit 1 [Capsicum annuum]KAF3637577.1 putative splicing factor 3A subunit 1 [Capsicum annuum]KAF3660257.1 putative splicing factor 3A subunit 1 [Capsicum annuum]